MQLFLMLFESSIITLFLLILHNLCFLTVFGGPCERLEAHRLRTSRYPCVSYFSAAVIKTL